MLILNKNVKMLLFACALLALLVGIGTVSAADDGNSTATAIQDTQSTSTATAATGTVEINDDNKQVKEQTTAKKEDDEEKTTKKVASDQHKSLKTAQVETKLNSEYEAVFTATKNNLITGTLADENDKPVSGATIKFSLNNTLLGTNQTDASGKYSYIVVPTAEGNNVPLVVSYDGDENYMGDVENLWVDIEKYPTLLYLDSVNDTKLNGTIVVTGGLTEMWTEKPIAGAAVSIVFNSAKTNTAITDENGFYTTNFTAPGSNGNYKIVATYSGSDAYGSYSDSAVVKIIQLDCRLVGNITNVASDGNTSTINVKAYDEYGKLIGRNMKISIKVNGKTQKSGVTISGGSADFIINLPRSNTAYSIYLVYGGSSQYYGTNTTFTYLNPLPKSTKLNATINKKVLAGGDDIIVTAKLVDSSNNPVSNVPVVITIGNGNYSANTDENGLASQTYTLPDNWEGTRIFASFEGNYDYYSATSNTITLEAYKYETTLTSDAGSIFTINKANIIKGTLIDEDKNPVAGAAIKFSLNNTLLGTNQTNSAGEYCYEVVPTVEGTNVPLVVSYDGDDKYMGDAEKLWVDIEKYQSMLYLNPIKNATMGSAIVVSGSLTEMWTEKAIAGADIKVVVSGLAGVYAAKTDANGNFNVAVAAPGMVGNYTVVAAYDGSDSYAGDADSANFSVKALDTAMVLDNVTISYGKSFTLKATITDENGNLVNGGKVAFKLNGKTIKDNRGNVIYAAVVNGICQITVNNTYNAKTYEISASYSGMSNMYKSARADGGQLTVVRANTTMAITPSTYMPKAGDTITITVNNSDTLASTGKVIVKINGRSIRDSNGNVVAGYLKRGKAVLKVKISSHFKAGKYNLSVVYINNNYNRCEASADIFIAEKN